MKTLPLLSACLGLFCFVACTSVPTDHTPELPPACSIQELQDRYVTNSYEYFVASYDYPKTMKIYRNSALLEKMTSQSPIYICLEQQRGRLYVDGFVAMDWPVSTGITSRPTPPGNFKIIEKKATYASNLYGKMLDAEGNCIDSDAKASDEVPEGGKFVPAPMPYWQRLTNDGIGMHIGRVSAGRRLSHGCIRTPRPVASELFKLTTNGKTPVFVVSGLEAPYYVKPILVQKKGLPKWTPRIKPAAPEQAAASKKSQS